MTSTTRKELLGKVFNVRKIKFFGHESEELIFKSNDFWELSFVSHSLPILNLKLRSSLELASLPNNGLASMQTAAAKTTANTHTNLLMFSVLIKRRRSNKRFCGFIRRGKRIDFCVVGFESAWLFIVKWEMGKKGEKRTNTSTANEKASDGLLQRMRRTDRLTDCDS